MKLMTRDKNGEQRLSNRALAMVLAVSILVSTFAIAVPHMLKATAYGEASDSGTVEFTDADFNYDSKLKDNGDGTFTYTLDFTAGVSKQDESVNKDVSGDGYFEAPFNGAYQIRLWGGDGANGGDSWYNNGGKGGAGGYVYGIVTLNKGDILYYKLGGDGEQTLVEEEGGGVNGDGGAHGNWGSYYVGGGGGYSAVYLFKNGEEADYFKDSYLDNDGELVTPDAYESDRTSKFIMVAAGGGGGGAGDGFVLGFKARGTADGGNGGTISENGLQPKSGKSGTVFAGTDGQSTGKKNNYVGHGATNVPGATTETWLTIFEGEEANDWYRTVSKTALGGHGSAGDLRGGAGGAGFCGGSGGIMAGALLPYNVGGGGGGSSFVASTVNYESSLISSDVKTNTTNPRDASLGKGGFIEIDLVAKTDSEQSTAKLDLTWLDELTFSTEISEYFDVLSVTVQNATVDEATKGQIVKIKNAELVSKGSAKLEIKLQPKDDFAGGNYVNLFKNTGDTPEFTIGNIPSGQGATNSINIEDTTSYVNVPLNNFDIGTQNLSIPFGTDSISADVIEKTGSENYLFNTDKYATAQMNKGETGYEGNYKFISAISNYTIVDDKDNTIDKDTTLAISDNKTYTLSYTVTPKETNTAVVGTPVTETTFEFISTVEKAKHSTLNGVNYDVTKTLTQNEDGTYKLVVSVNTSSENDELIFTQDASASTTPVDFSKSEAWTVPATGYYLIQAWGAMGAHGGDCDASFMGTPYAGGNGAQGEYVYNVIYLEKDATCSIDVGINGTKPGPTSGNKQHGTGGPGGTYSAITVDGSTAIVAAGGGGGGGGNKKGSSEGNIGGDASSNTEPTAYVETITLSAEYNGKPGGTGVDNDYSATIGGASPNSAISTSFTTLSSDKYDDYDTSAISSASSATAKDTPAVIITYIPKNIIGESDIKAELAGKLDNFDINSQFSAYFKDVSVQKTDGTINYKVDKTGDVVTNCVASLEGLKWTFTFKDRLDDGFLGGNQIPVLKYKDPYGGDYDTGLQIFQSDQDGKLDIPKSPSKDFVNIDLVNPITVTGKNPYVDYGSSVADTDVFEIEGTWPSGENSWKADFVNRVNTITPETEFPYTATVDKSFSYTYGVEPKSSTSTAALGDLQTSKEATVSSDVTVRYKVTRNLTHMTYDGPDYINIDQKDTSNLKANKPLVCTLEAEQGYKMPTSITVKVGDTTLTATQYQYNKETGSLTVEADLITNNVTIIAATDKPETFKLNYYYVTSIDDEEPTLKYDEYEAGATIVDKTASYTPDASTIPTGYKYYWDWNTENNAPLTTMPGYNYWVVGSYEPLHYKLKINYLDKATGLPIADPYGGDDGANIWFTLEDSVPSPSVKGYKLDKDTEANYSFKVDSAFVGGHNEGDLIEINVYYNKVTGLLEIRHVLTDTGEVEIETDQIDSGKTYTTAAKTTGVYANYNKVDLDSSSDPATGTMTDAGVVVIYNYSSPKSLTVTFNANASDASVTPTSKTVTYNDLYGTLPTPTRTGYTFEGWYTNATWNATGSTLITADSEVKLSGTQTLYAKWVKTTTANVAVTDLNDKPIEGAKVELLDSEGNSFKPAKTYTTDENGEVDISDILAGSYKIKATAGDKTKTVDFVASGENTKDADIKFTDYDTTEPVISVSGYTSGTWTNQDVSNITVTDSSDALGDTTIQYSLDGGKTWVDLPADGKLPTITSSTDVKIKATSESGVVSETTISVKIDKTAPTGTVTVKESSWKEFLNTITFGLFFNNTASATITPDTETGGAPVTTYYYVSQNDSPALTEAQVKALGASSWTKGTSVSVDPDKKFVVYAKLVDEAGNVTYLSSDGAAFDQTKPVISITSNETGVTTANNGTSYGDRFLKVTEDNLDSVTINGTPLSSQDLEKVKNGTYKLENDGTTYTIVATDKAGNTDTYTLTLKPVTKDGDNNDFIDSLDDNWVDKDNPTLEEVKDAIKDAQDLLDTEGDNLDQTEKDALQNKIDELTQKKNELNSSDITGTVQDKDGNPVPGATVELKDKNGNSFNPKKTTTTDENGNYTFKNVPDGEYTIEVTIPKSTDPADGNITEQIGSKTDPITKEDGKITSPDDVINETGAAGHDGKIDPAKLDDYSQYTDISGTVVDNQTPAQPVKGATVELLDKDNNPVKDKDGNPITATTDKDGNYTLEGVPAGDDYKIKITPPDGSTPTTLDDVDVRNGDINKDQKNNETGASTPDGKIDDPTSLSNYQATTDVKGNVVDGQNPAQPVKNAKVELLYDDGHPVKDKDNKPIVVYTDENGNFVIPDVPDSPTGADAQNYTVKITSPDGKDTTSITNMNISNGKNSKDTKNNTTGQEPADGFLDDSAKLSKYKATTDIKGKVEDGQNPAQPVNGAKVELLDKNGQPVNDKNGQPIVVYTDKNGDYVIPNVPDGEDYQIRITAPDNSGTPVVISDVDVQNGTNSKDVSPKDGVIDDAAKLTGYKATTDVGGIVKDAQTPGVPVPGATVVLKDKDGKTVATTTTDENGKFNFKVPDGQNYSIEITSPDGKDKITVSGISISNGTNSEDTSPKDGLLDGDLKFANYENKNVIKGTVTDKNGDPVKGATVELLDKDGNPLVPPRTTTTDENGNYVFDNVPNGEYQVKITAPDNSETTTIKPVTAEDGNVGPDTNKDGKVDGGQLPKYDSKSEIEGVVTDKNGKPVEGATVELLDKDGNSFSPKKTTTTDKDGKYKFEDVPDGEYQIKVTAPYTTGTDTTPDTTTVNPVKVLNNKVTPDDNHDGLVDGTKLNNFDSTAKDDLKDDIQKAADDAKKEIDNLPNLTDEEKDKLKDEIQNEADKAKDDVDKAKNQTELDKAKKDGEDAIKDTVDDGIAKDFVNKYASGDDNDPYDKKDDPVDENNTDQILSGKDAYDKLSETQKQKVNDLIKTPSNTEKGSTAPETYPTYNGYPDMLTDAEAVLAQVKDKDKKAVDDAADKAKKTIDELDTLTDKEKEDLKKQIDDEADKAKKAIDDAKTVADANKAKDDGIDNINDILLDAMAKEVLESGNVKVEVAVEGLVDLLNTNADSEDEIKRILSKSVELADADVFAAGGHIEIVMTIREIESDTVNEKAIKDDGCVAVKHIEITIEKVAVGDTGSVIYDKAITRTAEPISFVVPLGDAAKDDRVFYVYADHGRSVAEKTPDGDGVAIKDTVQFTSQDFSVFSIAYSKEEEGIAGTGEGRQMIGMIALAAVAAPAFMFTRKKKDDESEED